MEERVAFPPLAKCSFNHVVDARKHGRRDSEARCLGVSPSLLTTAQSKTRRHHLNFNSRVVFGGKISRRSCASGGLLTFERRPSFWRRRWTSCHDGGSSDSCSQWATEASSHHCRSRGITLRCVPAIMKARIDCSSFHTVRVQKIKRASLSTDTARFPDAALACYAERSALIKNAGK